MLVRAGTCRSWQAWLLLQLLAGFLPQALSQPITFKRVPTVKDVPLQDLARLQRCLTKCAVNTNDLVTAFDANLTGACTNLYTYAVQGLGFRVMHNGVTLHCFSGKLCIVGHATFDPAGRGRYKHRHVPAVYRVLLGSGES